MSFLVCRVCGVFVVSRLLCVGSCSLLAVRYLFVDFCFVGILVFGIRYLLFVVCCSLLVLSCLLFVAGVVMYVFCAWFCWLLCVVCSELSSVSCSSVVVCCLMCVGV